jgi:hypothetical protein
MYDGDPHACGPGKTKRVRHFTFFLLIVLSPASRADVELDAFVGFGSEGDLCGGVVHVEPK